MKASVIFTTYNHPKWLEKVLWGFSVQSNKDFEIIIADDGSTDETRELVNKFIKTSGLKITHIWHQDNGFQKCRILNRAIQASRAEYLIFTDGDCIPHPDFVKNHLNLAEENTFLSGGYFKLPMNVSKNITQQNILEKLATQPLWLLKNGVPFSAKISKLFSHPFWGALLDKLTITKPSWNGHSASTWKELVVKCNGFDERMQYGGQDREFGERLVNMGVQPKQVRYRCSCVHLDHKRGYARPESIKKNRNIRKDTRTNNVIRTDFGIAQMPDIEKH